MILEGTLWTYIPIKEENAEGAKGKSGVCTYLHTIHRLIPMRRILCEVYADKDE